MSPTVKNYVILSLAGIVLLLIFLMKCKPEPNVPKEIVKTITIEKEAKLDSAKFQKRIDSLARVAKQTKASLNDSKSKLGTAEKNVEELLSEVARLTDSLNNQRLDEAMERLLSSLRIEKEESNRVIVYQDSLIETFEQQVAVRDEALESVRKTISLCLTSGYNKEDIIKSLNKKLRKRNIGTAVWKTISGILTLVIIKQAL